MDELKIANVYSSSLIEIAEENGNLDDIAQQMLEIQVIFDDNPELESLINTPKISTSTKNSIMDNIFKGNIDISILNTFKVLIGNKRHDIFPILFREFKNVSEKRQNKVSVTITSARELEKSVLKNVTDAIKNKVNQDISTTIVVNKILLGGIEISIGDLTIDASMRGHLKSIKDNLLKDNLEVSNVIE